MNAHMYGCDYPYIHIQFFKWRVGGGEEVDAGQHLYRENIHKHKVYDQRACYFEPLVIKDTLSKANKSPTRIIIARWNGEWSHVYVRNPKWIS